MAPEVRNFQSYNSKADIFSIGALIFDMANGKSSLLSYNSCYFKILKIKLFLGDPFVRVMLNEYATETK